MTHSRVLAFFDILLIDIPYNLSLNSVLNRLSQIVVLHNICHAVVYCGKSSFGRHFIGKSQVVISVLPVNFLYLIWVIHIIQRHL